MANAKEEFIDEIKDRVVKCVYLKHGSYCIPDRSFFLKIGHSGSDYSEFLNSIDFNYEDGYGTQELHGFIWYEDGTYSERGEYDGSEWWEHKSTPDIPNECI